MRGNKAKAVFYITPNNPNAVPNNIYLRIPIIYDLTTKGIDGIKMAE